MSSTYKISLLLIFFSLSVRSGLAQDFHLKITSDSTITASGDSVNVQRHGKWSFKDQSGQLVCIGFYKMGVQDSIWIRYDNLRVREIIRLKEGKRNGVYTSYDQRQAIVSEANYENDILEGRTLFSTHLSFVLSVEFFYNH